MARLAARRLEAATLEDFRGLLRAPPEGWCWCVAWEVPTWAGWRERGAAENHALRESLWADGAYHGYIFYRDDRPIGWCRVGPTAVWPKLCRDCALAPSADDHVLTCFGMRPEHRRQGHLHRFLGFVLDDLARRRVARVFAVPRRLQGGAQDGQLWNGPAAIFIKAGFTVTHETEHRVVMARDLAAGAP